MMPQITKSIIINSSLTHVWDTMLNHPSYEQWTSVFNPGSTYQGSRAQGSTIKFISPDGSGMEAQIIENTHHERISIKHHCEISTDKAGKTLTKAYDVPMYENYNFVNKHDATTVTITMDGVPEEYMNMFDKTRPDALEQLKLICETNE